MIPYRYLLTFAVTIAGVGPVHSTEPASAITIERNVLYSTAGGEKLYLDIAIPPGEGPFPCVVLFHGGAWTGGSRKDLSTGSKNKDGTTNPSWIEQLAEHGYVAASVGYRLAPKHKFPAMIEDARSSVRFLRAHAKTYKINPEKFGAIGFSAGAHLSLLLGLCDSQVGFDVGNHLDQSGRVQCVVDFFGPTDLSLYSTSPDIVEGWLVPVFGKECKTDPKVYEKASPLSYVCKDAPPILILHGTIDVVVPIKHSDVLKKALTNAGCSVEMVTVSFAGHGGWGDRDMRKARDATLKFLDKHLKGTK
jgi:acetyl esterase/lipase